MTTNDPLQNAEIIITEFVRKIMQILFPIYQAIRHL